MRFLSRFNSLFMLLSAFSARRAVCALCILVLVPAAVAASRSGGIPAAAALPARTNAPSETLPASSAPFTGSSSPASASSALQTAGNTAAAAGSAAAPSPCLTAVSTPMATREKGADLRAVQMQTAIATPKPKPTAPPATPKPAASGSALFLRVYKGSQCVVALRVVEGKETAVRVMICSTGRSSGMTPDGTFKISSKYPYRQLEGAMGQYCSRFNGSILFHSVPIANSAKTQASGKSRMLVSDYNKLGRMASHGCVRMLVRDAKWIYGNCPAGTRVEVVGGSSPFGKGGKPALTSGSPYMSADGKYGWDPTDPDDKNPYRNPPSSTAPAIPAPTEPPAPTPGPTASPAPTEEPAATPAPADTSATA